MGEHSGGERIGELIAERRKYLGLSEEDVARKLSDATGYTPSRTDVWRWETEYEGRTPGPQYLPHLAEVLELDESRLRRARAATKAARRFKMTSSPAEVIARLLPDDTVFSPLGTSTGNTVGAADAQALLRRVHGLRLADDVLAGGDLVETVVRELCSAVRLHNDTSHTEAVGRRLLTGIGELAQLAGWVATDSGGRADPVPLFRLGVAAAQQADDGPLASYLLGSWGYWEANRGNVQRGIDLVRAAEHEVAAGPVRARSLTSARLAWVATLAGDQRTALTAIGTAMDQVDAADEEMAALADPRRWLYWVNRDEQEVMQARVHTQLHRPLRAVPLLRKVLTTYDASHAREYALYASWLAVALADANEPEEAAKTAHSMFEVLAGIPSSRAQDRSKAVVTALRRYRDVPEIAEVLAQWVA
ncbi:helix-turn-helix transcriptional regulator [Kitasatospora sp. YST-16]|uniref:helix-turn-helix domain-containing protein n=1 Tax=Kitasatospora sp. YST-16 TaxID=2998080 RepID=UPI002284D0A2|nr:helix-turn-helix transcriptional regulator [Kitasatospora sp. YST-16]WAL73541.1 helix-turn-helix transcriptional regulator [Kitasatospora sp. YST-16]WNW39597.1 helix-turn-helix transcriptional regulator [Streptomyces sp. Li-HN-5-13]